MSKSTDQERPVDLSDQDLEQVHGGPDVPKAKPFVAGHGGGRPSPAASRLLSMDEGCAM